MKIALAIAYTIAFPAWLWASYRWYLLSKASGRKWHFWVAVSFVGMAIFDAAAGGYQWGNIVP